MTPASDLRRSLSEPGAVCSALGLMDGAKPQGGGGLLIRCPWHEDKNPSCSVRRGADGTIAIKCHGCGASGDVLHLVAAVNGLDVKLDFAAVLEKATDLAGGATPALLRRSLPAASAPRAYPLAAEVRALWCTCVPVLDDAQVAAWLDARLGRAVAGDVELRDLARALPPGIDLPQWARYQGQTWAETGHRLVVPMLDHSGVIRSVRARRVVESDSPKSLPPSGHAAGGLVFGDALARTVLATGRVPDIWPATQTLRIFVVEGEVDFVSAALDFSDADVTAPAVLGITSGSWTAEIAARIPSGSEVRVLTDLDASGERYAEAIIESLRGRCRLFRTDGVALAKLLADRGVLS